MLTKSKFFIATGLSCLVSIVALTSMTSQRDETFKNLKVLPKDISHDLLEKVMHDWSGSLGVHCDFCHVKNADGKGLNFESDAKPEKHAAREMYEMMNGINKKYFEAKKDSSGMIMTTGVNCYTCHRGVPHPEIKLPEMHMGPPGGGPGWPPPNNPGMPPPPPPSGDHKE